MKLEYTDIFIAGQPPHVQQTVLQVFTQSGFSVELSSTYTGKARRGSAGMNIMFGALAQYYEVDFQILTLPDGTVVLRLIKMNTGLAGGIIGVSEVDQQFSDIVYIFSNYFHAIGQFRGRYPA